MGQTTITSQDVARLSKATPEERAQFWKSLDPEGQAVLRAALQEQRGSTPKPTLSPADGGMPAGAPAAPTLQTGPTKKAVNNVIPGVTPPDQIQARPQPPQPEFGAFQGPRMRGTLQGASAGYGEESTGLVQMLGQKIPPQYMAPLGALFPPLAIVNALQQGGALAASAESGNMGPMRDLYQGGQMSRRPAADLYTEGRDSERRANETARQSNPDAYDFWQAAGSMPRYMAAPGGLGASMIQGGVEGIGNSNAQVIGPQGLVPGPDGQPIPGGRAGFNPNQLPQAAVEGGFGALTAGAAHFLGGQVGAGLKAGGQGIMRWVAEAENVVAAAIRSGREELVQAAQKMLQERLGVLKALQEDAMPRPSPHVKPIPPAPRDAPPLAPRDVPAPPAVRGTGETVSLKPRSYAEQSVAAIGSANEVAAKRATQAADKLTGDGYLTAFDEAYRAPAVAASKAAEENAAQLAAAKAAKATEAAKAKAAQDAAREAKAYAAKKAAYEAKEASFQAGETVRRAKLYPQVLSAKNGVRTTREALDAAESKAMPDAVRAEADAAIKAQKPVKAALGPAVKGGLAGSLLPVVGTTLGATAGFAISIAKTMKDPLGKAAVARTIGRITFAAKAGKISPEVAGKLMTGLTRGLVQHGAKGFFESLNEATKQDPAIRKVTQTRLANEDNPEKLLQQIADDTGQSSDEMNQLLELGAQSE
jgi:hypothetical protein